MNAQRSLLNQITFEINDTLRKSISGVKIKYISDILTDLLK